MTVGTGVLDCPKKKDINTVLTISKTKNLIKIANIFFAYSRTVGDACPYYLVSTKS